ncbi:MAG: 30S ribosomal protein S14 [Gammaproteobacteria bacterium]|nr:30S ribosomal protein S14 [Gammaproteobacteria bacterium]
MAKTCMINRDKKRKKLATKARTKREALRAIVKNQNVSFEEKMLAVTKLNKCPRNESAIRMRNRCQICGRPRGVYRKFGLCRVHLREAAVRGDLPGLIVSSW